MSPWTDERLNAAYLTMTDEPAPRELAAATVAAIHRAAEERPSRRDALGFALGRPALRLLGSGVAVVIVAGIVAGLALRSATGPATGPTASPTTGPTGSPSASPTTGPTSEPTVQAMPTTVDGLTVESVSHALAAEKSGAIVGDSLVAIKGWYNPMFWMGCPAETPAPALVETCSSRRLVITENKEQLVVFNGNEVAANMTPSGPYVDALEPDGSYVEAELPVSDQSSPASYDPSPVIIVGHFHDVRASACGSDEAACDAAFVADQLAWFDGKSFGPNVWTGADAADHVLKPRLGADGVAAALRSELGPDDTIVSMGAVGSQDLYTLQPGRGVSSSTASSASDVEWYVRVAGPEPRWPEMAFAGGSSGWLVVADDSGQLMEVGGWGFVPADDPSYVPSVRTLPSGDLALPTVNALVEGLSLCAGVGVDAVLHGSATDPRIAWLVSNAPFTAGKRVDVVWPAGYRARFTPSLEILDENGNVVLSAGSHVTGLCDDGGALLMPPPFP